MRSSAKRIECDLCGRVTYEDMDPVSTIREGLPAHPDPVMEWRGTTYKDLCESCVGNVNTLVEKSKQGDYRCT